MNGAMPTKDHPRMSLAQEMPVRITKVPNTMFGLASWLEDCVTKSGLGVKMGCQLEPRSVLTV
eukprot:3126716-Prorocentrum_lima.AAC.1